MAKSAETPLVFKRDNLDQLDILENLDIERLDGLALEVKHNAGIYNIASLRDEMREEFEKSPHIEAQIYDDFDAFDRDRYLMEDFHFASASEKSSLARQFSDYRFRSFAKRIMYENFPDQMTSDEIVEFQLKISERITVEDDEVPWTTKQKALDQCERLLESRGDIKLELNSIKDYLENL